MERDGTGDDGGESHGRLAPVIPLFDQDIVDPSPSWRTTWAGGSGVTGDADEPVAAGGEGETAGTASMAETLLLRRLRTRSLSVAEARTLLAEQGVPPEGVDEIVAAFEGRGYLDDAALAEQVVHVSVDRKGQGRQAVSRALSARRIPRELVDRALASLPDDDADRALDYARSKARSLRGLPPETALRRLSAQLARRGYASSAALHAARTALDEARAGG